MELMLERMGELSNSIKDWKIERFQEYVVFSMGGFGSFATTLGTVRYWSELESTLGRKFPTHREIPSRQGVLAPFTNRYAKAIQTLD